jgi:hypothetical protein
MESRRDACGIHQPSGRLRWPEDPGAVHPANGSPLGRPRAGDGGRKPVRVSARFAERRSSLRALPSRGWVAAAIGCPLAQT